MENASKYQILQVKSVDFRGGQNFTFLPPRPYLEAQLPLCPTFSITTAVGN